MPNSATHRRQALHNEALLAAFDTETTPFRDWMVIAIFYAALHHIESYLATKNVHLHTHLGRENLIWAVHELRPIYDDYRRLKHRSELARYDAVAFSADQVRALSHRTGAHQVAHLRVALARDSRSTLFVITSARPCAPRPRRGGARPLRTLRRRRPRRSHRARLRSSQASA